MKIICKKNVWNSGTSKSMWLDVMFTYNVSYKNSPGTRWQGIQIKIIFAFLGGGILEDYLRLLIRLVLVDHEPAFTNHTKSEYSKNNIRGSAFDNEVYTV